MSFAIKHKPSLSSKIMGKHSMKLLVIFSLMALGECAYASNTLGEANHILPKALNKHEDVKNLEHSKKLATDMEEFEAVLFDYVGDVLSREKINIARGVYFQKITANNSEPIVEKKSLDENLISKIKEFAETHLLRVDLARATTETGRLFFFKGK